MAQQIADELETTMAANSDDMYAAPDQCCPDCGSDEILVIEVNAARGRRKRVTPCWEHAQHYKDAPSGLYDPTVLAYHPESEYDGMV